MLAFTLLDAYVYSNMVADGPPDPDLLLGVGDEND